MAPHTDPSQVDGIEVSAVDLPLQEMAAKPASPPPVARFELKLPDGTLRQIAGVAEIRDDLIAGTIPGDTPCRSIVRPAKDGRVKETAWSTVADTIGRSGFEARILFRPVWAHSIAGLGVGAAIGNAAWMLLNIFAGLRLALELSGPGFNDRGHFLAAKFAAYTIVCLFWFLSGAIPLLAATLRAVWLNNLAAVASRQAFKVAIGALIVVGVISQKPAAVIAGIVPGLGAAFGSLIAGVLVLSPPGTVIGTVTGLIRASSLNTAARREREPLWLPLLAGILLPITISGAAALLWLRYGASAVDAIVQGFIR